MAIRETDEARRRVTKRPEERRQEIMDAAVRVFREKGIEGATVADITDASGVAKGTFYLYFESKEALLGALKHRFVDDLIAHAAGFVERVGKDDWWALAEQTAEGMVDFMLERRDEIAVYYQERMTPETEQLFAECHDKLVTMFAMGIQEGIQEGVFDTSDPLLTASFLNNAIEGTVQSAIMYGRDLDRARLIAGAKELIRKTLAPLRSS